MTVPASRPIFRKVALDRLANPEQLDRLMTVTAPKDWVALMGIAGIALIALSWSIAGRLPITVGGQGILIRRGGVLDVVSLGSGQLTAIYVDVGDVVEKDQIVARIARPDLVKEIERQKASLLELESQHETLEQFGTEDVKLREEKLEQEKAAARAAIAAARSRVEWLSSKLTEQKELLSKGLITEQTVRATMQEIEAARQEIRSADVLLRGTSVSALEQAQKRTIELEKSRMTIAETERGIRALEAKLEEETRVTSAYRGRVLELRANIGDVVSSGVPILNLDPMDEAITEIEDLEALIYVPATEGKKIRAGMNVQISPSVAKREEHGYLLGAVTFVADFPATTKGMMRVLGNEELVKAFLAKSGGTVLTVRASLVRDTAAPTGYAWSSGRGPQGRLTTGTPCQAWVRVEEQRPISFVVPALKQLFSGS